jgi:hypothetical protein
MLITFHSSMIVTMLDFLNANLFSPFLLLFIKYRGIIFFLFDLLYATPVDIRMAKYVFVECSVLKVV